MRGVAKRLVGGVEQPGKQATPELARNARCQKKIPKIETETNIKSKKKRKERKKSVQVGKTVESFPLKWDLRVSAY